jgi:hypothetical protein
LLSLRRTKALHAAAPLAGTMKSRRRILPPHNGFEGAYRYPGRMRTGLFSNPSLLRCISPLLADFVAKVGEWQLGRNNRIATRKFVTAQVDRIGHVGD